MTKDIRRGVFPLQEVRALVLCICRADVFSRDRELLQEVVALLEAVQKQRPGVVVYYSSPFPRRSDDPQRVCKLYNAGTQLKAWLYNRRGAHFFPLVDKFTSPTGLILDKWDDRCLNEEALKFVAKSVEQMVSEIGPAPLHDLKVTVDFE